MLPIIFCPEKAQLQDNLNEVKRYLAYPKSAQLDKKTEELICLAKDKGTPVLEGIADDLRVKAINVTKDVLKKLETK